MAVDIEFNVRNGMTVGGNKHMVLDINGALSGSNVTCTTGQFLSGGNDLLNMFSSSEVATTVTSNSASWNDSVSAIADATDTGISTPLAGDVLVYVNGTTQQWQNKKDRASLEDMYNYANANFYSELIYTGTQLTGINVWVNDQKNTAYPASWV